MVGLDCYCQKGTLVSALEELGKEEESQSEGV